MRSTLAVAFCAFFCACSLPNRAVAARVLATSETNDNNDAWMTEPTAGSVMELERDDATTTNMSVDSAERTTTTEGEENEPASSSSSSSSAFGIAPRDEAIEEEMPSEPRESTDEEPTAAAAAAATTTTTSTMSTTHEEVDATKETVSSMGETTSNIVEDIDEEDEEDSTTAGEGAKEVRSADEAFESEALNEKEGNMSETETTTITTSERPLDVEKTGIEQSSGDAEIPSMMMTTTTEQQPSSSKAGDAVGFAAKVETRLQSLYGESTPKQKSWLEKVKAIHRLEGAASFTESEEVCGSTGTLAVLTVWDHVPEAVRQAIGTFLAAEESESTSPHSLLSLRLKAMKLIQAYDVVFKGDSMDERNECVANYITRQKVHQIMERLDAVKDESVDKDAVPTEEETNARDVRVGRVAKHLKQVIAGQLKKMSATRSADADSQQAGGTTFVLALNCRAEHRHRLIAAVAHAIRAKFGMTANDYTLVVGKRAVSDELDTLLNIPYDSLSSKRDGAAIQKQSNARSKSAIQVCPDLPGTSDPDKPVKELSSMEKAMREAENHILLEHQGSEDPTNPHHMNAGGGVRMGALPGMPQMFNSNGMGQQQSSGDNLARSEARRAFGISDNVIGSHNTDHLRRGRVAPASYSERAPERVAGGFNAMPKVNDPLDGYMRGDAAPKRYLSTN